MIGPSFPHVLVAAQGGDEQSFEMLWQDLHPPLLRYLQVLAPAAAEDRAADTWLGVIRARWADLSATSPASGLGVHHRPASSARLAHSDEPTADRVASCR